MLGSNTNKLAWIGVSLGIVLALGTTTIVVFPNAMPDLKQAIVNLGGTTKEHVDKKVSLSDQQQTLYREYKERYFVTKGDQTYVNSAPDGASYVVSEGQGYGMILASVAGDKSDFESLYQYYLANRYNSTELMSWRQDKNPDKVYDNNATDGDLYIVQSLYKAYDRWGDKAYLAQANKLASAILTYNYNSQDKFLTLGNWAGSDTSVYHDLRASDIIPTFYENIYQHNRDERWHELAENGYVILKKASDATTTGLIPDNLKYQNGNVTILDKSPLDNTTDNNYSYDALRVPLNMALSDDDSAKAVNQKMLAFFDKQSPIKAGYNPKTGAVTGDYVDVAFLAPIYAATVQNSGYANVESQVNYLATKTTLVNSYYPDSQILMSAYLKKLN